jgi:LEA14-like dessication related protein
MNITRLAILTLLGISLSACAGIRPEPPQIQLMGLEISEVSLSHANFLATLQLFNPNNASLNIERINFTLFLNDTRITKGLTAIPFTIPAGNSSEAVIRLSSSFLDLYQLTRHLHNQNEITFRIAGEVKIGGYGLLGTILPIEHEGTLLLPHNFNQILPSPPQKESTNLPEGINSR